MIPREILTNSQIDTSDISIKLNCKSKFYHLDRTFVDLMDNLPGYSQAPQILLLRFMPGSRRLDGGVHVDAIMDRIVHNDV